MRMTLSIIFIALLAGCSKREIYDNILVDQRNRCIHQRPSEYDECIKRTSKSYEEYERERQELLHSDE